MTFNPTWICETDVKDSENQLSLLLRKIPDGSSLRSFCGYSTNRIATILLGNSYANTQNRQIAHYKSLIASLLPKKLFPSKTSGFTNFFSEAENLTVSESVLEVCMQHLLAILKGIQTMTPWILILEDDAVLNKVDDLDISSLVAISKNFIPKKTIIHLNSSRDMTDKFNGSSKDFNGVYRIKPPSTRNACAYLISRDASEMIIQALMKSGIPRNLPIDFLLQIASRSFNFKTFWQEPPLFLQGSETGYYASNFEGNRYLK